MSKNEAEIEQLESRCEGLEAALGCVLQAIIGRLPDGKEIPNPPAFLEQQFRAAAKESRDLAQGQPAAELLDRWAEWMAQEKGVFEQRNGRGRQAP